MTNQTFDIEHHPHRIASRTDGTTTTYGYDADGNRISASGGSSGTRSYRFDSANRLVCTSTSASCTDTNFRYDVDGALIRRGTSTGLGYIEFDELVTWPEGGAADPIKFRVFAFGEEFAYRERTQVSPRTASLWGAPGGFEPPGWEVLVAFTGAGLAVFAMRLRPLEQSWQPKTARELASAVLASGLVVVLIFPPLPARAGGPEGPMNVRYYLLNDAIGSTTALLLDDGTPTESLHAPFGGMVISNGAGERRFAGHRENSGLHYMQARWQDPETGMFLSVDPLIVPSDPQSHTAYSYARNNPVNVTDPTGMCGVGPLNIGSWGCLDPEVAMALGVSNGFTNGGLAQSFDMARDADRKGFHERAPARTKPNQGVSLGDSGPSYRMSEKAGFAGTFEAIYGTEIRYHGLLGGDVVFTVNNAEITEADLKNYDDAVKRAFDSKTLLDRVSEDNTIIEVGFEYNNSSQFEYRVYDNGAKRMINIDPNDKLQIRTPSGLKPYPLERAIVHELGHHPQGGIGPSLSQNQAIILENKWATEYGQPLRRQ